VSRRAPATAAIVGLAAALLLACEPLPQPFPRIVSASPTGTVPARDLRVEFTSTEALLAADVLGGARVALCLADDLREVKRLAEAGEPQPPGSAVEVHAELEDEGRRVVLRPRVPLVPGFEYAAVLAHGVRSADGRIVLDAEGRPRSVVVEFTVSPDVGPGVRAELAKVLADADAPEAGGEYLEVVNLGDAPLDLAGFRIAKRAASGSYSRCTIARRSGGPVSPGERGVVAGGAYDGRYALPATAPLYECGASAVAGGLANDRPPALLLEAPDGATLSSIGVAAPAPRCGAAALVRVDEAGPDAGENLACSDAAAPSAAVKRGP
jgi:hypothetical protein